MARTLWLLLALLALVAMPGCGGGSHHRKTAPGGGGGGGGGGTDDFPRLVRDEIGNTSDTRDPVDINGLDFSDPIVPEDEDFSDLLN